MGDFDLIFGLIPERAYKYIVGGLVFLLVFKEKIPILNKIDVKIHLPEEFMRHFRWITPLLLIFQIGFTYVIYLMLKQLINRGG